MNALFIDEPGKCSIRQIEEPELRNPEDVLLKVLTVGLCGSDLNSYLGKNPLVSYPRIPGHEISAQIVETGSEVPSEYSPGALVTVVPYTNCGQCSACIKGRPNACRNNQTLGVQREGAITEYLTAPYPKLLNANEIHPAFIPLIEPLAVGFHATRRARIKQGNSVAIWGCGIIGIGALLGSMEYTDNVIAIDISEDKLEQVSALGIPHSIHSGKQNLEAELQRVTGGMGPDVCIEAVGRGQTFVQCVEQVCYAGKVVYIGYAREPVCYETKIFLLKELDIMGSRGAEYLDFQNVKNFMQKKCSDLNPLLSAQFSLEEGCLALPYWEDHQDKIFKITVQVATSGSGT